MLKLEKTLKIMKVSSVALTMASAAALVVAPMSWDAAYAKGGNGNGGGNGKSGENGGGNGKGGSQTARGNSGGGKPAHVTTRKSSTATASVDTEVEIIEDDVEVTEEEEIEEPRNHGALASELKGLNAAHANPNALANASPNSMPGKLATYRDSINEVADAEAAVTDAEENVATADTSLTTAEQELDRLNNLTDDEIATEFPDGGFDDAVVDAEVDVIAAEEDLIAAEEDLTTAQEDLETAAVDSDGAIDTLTGGRALSDAALAELHRLLDI